MARLEAPMLFLHAEQLRCCRLLRVYAQVTYEQRGEKMSRICSREHGVIVMARQAKESAQAKRPGSRGGVALCAALCAFTRLFWKRGVKW